MTVELLLGDCLEILPTLKDKSVDAVITDPPYGIGENNKKNLSRAHAAAAIDYGEFDWDKEPAPASAIREMMRVSQNQVIFGGNYFALPPSAGWIVWDKQRTGDFSDCELAWTSYKRGVRKIEWMWNGMIRRGNEERFHPTQKPLGVMRWVVENYSKPGDTVFDPFMGSGTTGVAAVQLGRNFIGIEINPTYFEIAQRRIEEAQKQMVMAI